MKTKTLTTIQTLGVMMIVASLLCRYGAELTAARAGGDAA